ncbi:MAG: PSD1 and planctomycete cytochrome C domain-containing protein [Pirellulales bacterium]|nr:PSD1 and planctomycete cytochrome C domain-containing protein [Pirellulales bacterium]
MSSRSLFPSWLVLSIATSWCVSLPAGDIDFFERKIRPVLIKHCYQCHGGQPEDIKGGLRLDEPSAMLRGGDSGAAVMPGKPDESLLLAAIRYDGLEMPPSGPLDQQIIHDFEKWIATGAADPRESDSQLAGSGDREIDWDQAREFWSFRPPTRQSIPPLKNQAWTSKRLDGFVLAKLESEGLAPNPPTDRGRLLRRLSFDLVGLPPTPRQLQQTLSDRRPGAIARYVDQLLSSPAHAERWTRPWLDVARYAEDQAHKVGNNDSLTYPNAYYYRDWVINALAVDMPYDEFVRMQLAADTLLPEEADQHVALGFLGLGPKYYRRGSPEVMADEWEDRVDTVARGLLGLTVACARCHDHKYDPIPTSDYYSLAGVFASTEMFNRPIKNLPPANKKEDQKKPAHSVHIVRDGKPQDLNVMIRGDVDKPGPLAKRGFLTVLCPDGPVRFDRGSGRQQLAEAIVDRRNPLTARVIVNRVWHELIGQPLVGTPSNFGRLGELPSHPQLLDDLAVGFMENGWSLKWLQREIVLSSTYAQSSDIDPVKAEIDPQNRWLWRMPKRRLSIEAYRDSILAVSSQLDHRIGGRSLQPDDPQSNRRTVYSEVSRMDLNPMLARFDFPDPNAHSPKRFETNTPLQKLFLLNSPFLVQHAESLAIRLREEGGSYRSRIERAYQWLFARNPTSQEIQWAESFVASDDSQAWNQYAQTLLICNEMFMID